MDRVRLSVFLAILCSIFTSIAQILFKKASIEGGIFNLDYFILAIGITLYSASAAMLIISFRFAEVSRIYPILALNFAVVYFLSGVLLNEPTSALGWVGIISIVGGVIFLNL